MLPPQGFEYSVDGRLLSEARAGQAPVLCTLVPPDRPNSYSLATGAECLWHIGATHLIQTQVGGGGILQKLSRTSPQIISASQIDYGAYLIQTQVGGGVQRMSGSPKISASAKNAPFRTRQCDLVGVT